MPVERGSVLLNAAVGFSLFIGGFYLSDVIARYTYPNAPAGDLHPLIMGLCAIPFFLFLRWAKPTGQPLWNDCLSVAAVGLALFAIPKALKYYGVDSGLLLIALTMTWITLWHAINRRFLGTKRPDQEAT